jgi:hypothetical protein
VVPHHLFPTSFLDYSPSSQHKSRACLFVITLDVS